jgi:membrane protein required for colicin V production
MNIFDIIVYLSLAWAVFNGWRRGFLLQMLSLLAVVAALFFATQYGSELERILGIDIGVQGVVGFIVIFVAAMILIAVSGYVLRAVFRFAGLGAIDVLLGILFSVAKVALIVSVLFSWFDNANKSYEWASRECVAESRWYEPVKGITDKLTPYFEELTDKFLD